MVHSPPPPALSRLGLPASRPAQVHSRSAVQPFTAASSSRSTARAPLSVVAQKRVVKKEQVELMMMMSGLEACSMLGGAQ